MLWADQVASRLGFSFSSVREQFQRVDSPRHVLDLLQRAVREKIEVYGNFIGPFEREKFSPCAVDEREFKLEVLRAPTGIPPGLRLFFTLDRLTYSFKAEPVHREGSRVSVRTPAALNFGEQRHSPRRPLAPGDEVSARLRWRRSGRPTRAYPLVDLSACGFAMRVPGHDDRFHPGGRPAEVDLCLKGETLRIPPAEVRSVAHLGDEEGLRVGMEVGVLRRPIRIRDVEFPLAGASRRPRPARGVRQSKEAPRVNVVRYYNARHERIVGILDTTFGDRTDKPVPVVILPPATGRKKETLSALSLTLVENFRQRGRDIAVLRFDGIRRHGESTNDPEGRKPGMEMVHGTMGQVIEDIHTSLDFLYSDERFVPSKVIVISTSSASIEARRAIVEDGGRRIHYWVSLAGSPDFHDTLRNICGGLDLLGSLANGVSLGFGAVLGNTADLDHYFGDALDRRLVYLRDSLEDIAKVPIPITWIFGKYDDWVNPERVKNLMSVRSEGAREVISIPTGHQMRTSEEAMEAFKLVTACIWKFLCGSTIRPFAPPGEMLKEVREAERARLMKPEGADHREFWKDYLERKDRYLGFDIICETKAYRDLMKVQLDLLELREGVRLMDAGCGTSNFVELLLEGALRARDGFPMPGHVTLTDYVEEALETSRRKLEALALGAARPLPELEFRCVDLEISRLQPMAEALQGDTVRWEKLRGRVEGMPAALLRRLESEPDPLAARVARGEVADGGGAETLVRAYGTEGAEILADLGRAARFLRRQLLPDDFREPGDVDLDAPGIYERLDASVLRWKRLTFGTARLDFGLPFPDGAFDRIVSSLLTCYLYRPEATIDEFHRMLRPGGILVLSSMKPDTDVSRIYMRLIERLQSSEEVEIPEGFSREDLLNSARSFLNKAAGILNLEEDGAFEFVPREPLVEMLQAAGFRDVRALDSFGDPPQAYILAGTRA
jgi:ubiquinone/menaquinone biosynthesis C-methylase UbiE